MRVREILNNLPTSSRNRERFTINRTSIKKSAVKLIDPFTNIKAKVRDDVSVEATNATIVAESNND